MELSGHRRIFFLGVFDHVELAGMVGAKKYRL